MYFILFLILFFNSIFHFIFPFYIAASASWRGARDPTIEGAEVGQKREYNKSRMGEKREEFAGMGGMKRTR